MPAFPIYVMQDGADFYTYSDPGFTDYEPSLHLTAPFPVSDFDMEAAIRARKWFVDLCSNNQVIHWAGSEDEES